MADAFLQGFGLGANIAQGNLDRQLRAQQLRSQEAERMVRERLVSQEIADLKRKADEDIQLKAEVQKAASRMAMDLLESDSIPMQSGEQGPPMANPNKLTPEAAFLKNFLPLSKNLNEAAQMFATAARARSESPDSFANQIRLRNLEARERGLGISEDNLRQREIGTDLRRTGLTHSAINLEGDMAEKGQTPMVPTMPPGTPGPQGAAVGQPLIRQGPKPLSPANVSKHQENLSGALTGMAQIKRIEPLINSGTVGPRAAVESVLVDRGLANVFPELLNKERVQVGVLLSTLRANTLKALKSDSNITETERQELNSSVPSQAQLLNSPARAIEQLKTIQSTLVKRSIRNTIELRQPVKEEALPFLDQEDIAALLSAKPEPLITDEQAQQWFQLQKRQ